MTGTVVRFPMHRVVELRWYYGSCVGCEDDPDREAQAEAERSVHAALASLKRQKRNILLRRWAVWTVKEAREKYRTRRKWDQARRRELEDFVDRMMRKFAGADDEHLLRWIDRLEASEPPVAADAARDEPRHVSETVRGIVARCEANLPS